MTCEAAESSGPHIWNLPQIAHGADQYRQHNYHFDARLFSGALDEHFDITRLACLPSQRLGYLVGNAMRKYMERVSRDSIAIRLSLEVFYSDRPVSPIRQISYSDSDDIFACIFLTDTFVFI